jgi:RimJ/RimL family protein N-acetyltransferase
MAAIRRYEAMTALRPATLEDIPFIMATEQLPGYEGRIGQWSDAEHRLAMARPDHAYFIGLEAAGAPIGFAMLQQLDDPHGNLLFRRIAVAQPGQGHGGALFRAVTDWVFRETSAHRLYLHVYPHNVVASRLYRSCGFVEEGAAREARLLGDGQRVDVMTMSLLRWEWKAREDCAVGA